MPRSYEINGLIQKIDNPETRKYFEREFDNVLDLMAQNIANLPLFLSLLIPFIITLPPVIENPSSPALGYMLVSGSAAAGVALGSIINHREITQRQEALLNNLSNDHHSQEHSDSKSVSPQTEIKVRQPKKVITN